MRLTRRAETGCFQDVDICTAIEKLARYEDIDEDPKNIISINTVLDILRDEQLDRQSDLTITGGTEADYVWEFCQDLIDRISKLKESDAE